MVQYHNLVLLMVNSYLLPLKYYKNYKSLQPKQFLTLRMRRMWVFGGRLGATILRQKVCFERKKKYLLVVETEFQTFLSSKTLIYQRFVCLKTRSNMIASKADLLIVWIASVK